MGLTGSFWDVTFFYQEDLRSAYMNTLLKGLTRPGIFNQNIVLYTVPAGGSSPGVHCFIKKGTTFVFSDAYQTVNNKYIRDFDSVGTYIVKCTAKADIDFVIAELAYDANPNNSSELFGTDSPDIMFLYASYTYNPVAVAGDGTPNFAIAVPSSDATWGATYKLPNEDQTSTIPQTSYLILGTILHNTSAVDYSSWGNTETANWINNHVFTGRGLPEYSSESTVEKFAAGKNSLIFHKEYNKLYYTDLEFMYNGIFHNKQGTDWKVCYGQGTGSPIAFPTADTGAVINHDFTSSVSDVLVFSEPTRTSNGGKLLLDFLFLAIRTEYNRIADASIANLLTDTSLTTKIIPYRLFVNNTNTPFVTDSRTFNDNNEYSSTITSSIIPLDVSKINITRIKALFENRPVLMRVVDEIRRNEETSPFLSPTTGETLIPLFIGVRRVLDDASDYGDIAELDPYSKKSLVFSVKDDSNGPTSAINPANCITLSELIDDTYIIAGSVLEEVFTTVPFLS